MDLRHNADPLRVFCKCRRATSRQGVGSVGEGGLVGSEKVAACLLRSRARSLPACAAVPVSLGA
eukprot:7816778-Pyramimonas_sp.AAC.1